MFRPRISIFKQLGLLKASGGSGNNLAWVKAAMSTDTPVVYNFETLNVTRPKEFVVHVELNRPAKRNAQNKALYREMRECFAQLGVDPDCRAIVLSGAGKMFTSGIDLMDFASDLMQGDSDPGRRAAQIATFVRPLQESFTAIEQCLKPVIAAVHGGCIGGGVDMICACDIRYASQDAFFCVKEVDVGLAADLGTLQRFPRIVGNDSVVRELCYTARNFTADEAKSIGLLGRVLPDRDTLIDAAVAMAETIASKSPIAVQGTKRNLVYSRDRSVAEGLEYMITWNTAMLQSEDLMKAASAQMQKEKPVFSKL